MNPITSFLVFVCVLAGIAIGQWVNGCLALVFFGDAMIIAFSSFGLKTDYGIITAAS